MKVFQLRAFLKERCIKGYSTLKKAELEAKVKEIKEKEKAEKIRRKSCSLSRMRSLSK